MRMDCCGYQDCSRVAESALKNFSAAAGARQGDAALEDVCSPGKAKKYKRGQPKTLVDINFFRRANYHVQRVANMLTLGRPPVARLPVDPSPPASRRGSRLHPRAISRDIVEIRQQQRSENCYQPKGRTDRKDSGSRVWCRGLKVLFQDLRLLSLTAGSAYNWRPR